MASDCITGTLEDELLEIERKLDSGDYRIGTWQRVVANASQDEVAQDESLQEILTRVSNKLHRRNGFIEAPHWVGVAGETFVLIVSLAGAMADDVIIRVAAALALVLCLQPVLKLVAGSVVGVRYAYVYLWYIEPRFKMRYGTYLPLNKWRKVFFHFTGSLGTPLALLIGWQVLGDAPLIAMLFLIGCVVTTIMQVMAFVAYWFGIRKVGPFLLSNLTTPATLARELKGR